MLLKCTSERKMIIPSKGGLVRGTGMRMTMSTASMMTPRIHRKVLRIPSKRHPGKALPGKLHAISKIGPGKLPPGKRINPRQNLSVCDNSNDSGLGFDQYIEIQSGHFHQTRPITSTRSTQFGESSSEESDGIESDPGVKSKCRKIDDIQIDNDDACSNDAFIQKVATTTAAHASHTTATCTTTKYVSTVARTNSRPTLKRIVQTPQGNTTTASKDGSVTLEIVSQPEQQHRARYQTEGSRGAVKDRSGNGFPIVKMTGYKKAAVLQVFIGTDIGRVAPHMFYQACKVAGKNSTPCNEKKVDGTMLIEIDFKPESEMIITCDCVGILKERNVDVEHRFPDHSAQRSKKKSTRCRMVFRTQLTHDDGSVEILQVCSHPIVCTQPPGVPEICKKSLSACPAEGGLELFVIGKNFLKDTCVVFQTVSEELSMQTDSGVEEHVLWKETVLPDKEFLQQTHLICNVPPYLHPTITKPVTVQLIIISSGKRSEPHNFIYTPSSIHNTLTATTVLSALPSSITCHQDSRYADESTLLWSPNVIESKNETDSGMMPPPTTFPSTRRSSSTGNMLQDQLTQIGLKAETMDESSRSSIPEVLNPTELDHQFQVTSASASEASVDEQRVGEMRAFEELKKQNMDIISMDTMSMLNQAGSLQNFTSPDPMVNLHVKPEEMAAVHLQNQIMSATQNQSNVEKFLLQEDAVNKLKTDVESAVMAAAAANAGLFVTASNNQNAVFTQRLSPHLNPMAGRESPMETGFSNSILEANNSTASLSQILAMSPKSSKSVLTSPTSNAVIDAGVGVHSSVTQDIILNSQPAASINSVNLHMMSSGGSNGTPPEHITSELILNPTVSPTVMCQNNSDSGSLLNNQVTMANTILNDINIPSQTAQDTIINNLMINSVAGPIHETHKSPNVGVNSVNTMILKAAADFITNQEATINTNTTINALISLNNNQMLSDRDQHEVHQILNISTSPQVNSTTSNKSPGMTICPSQTSSLNQHLSLFNEATQISNQILEQNNQQGMIVSPNGHHSLNGNITSTTKNQESLLKVVSLVEKSKMNVQTAAVGSLVHNNSVGQPGVAVANPTIPQELTTMSDQDLISYINPSCFDQV